MPRCIPEHRNRFAADARSRNPRRGSARVRAFARARRLYGWTGVDPLPTSAPEACTVGELCIAGDWAIAHGEVETLAFISQRLAETVAEPLHCELARLAELARCDPDQAAAEWGDLKVRVLHHETAGS